MSGARRGAFVFGAVLFGLLAVYFWESLFLGRILFSFDLLAIFPPWRSATPPASPHNPLLSDTICQFLPWLQFTRDQLAEGRFPLWNPLISAGAPHFANHQSTVLFPLQVLHYVSGSPWTYAVIAVLKLYVSGLFTYLFVRSLGARAFAASLAGIAYALCGFQIVWLSYPLSNVANCVPVLFYFAEKLIARPSPRAAAVFGLVVAVQFLGGHLPTSAHLLLAVIAYFIHALRRPGAPHPRRAFTLFGLGLLLGAALAAIQLVPSLEYVGQSSELVERQHLRSRPTVFNAFRPDLAALLVFPYAYGSPVAHDYWGGIFGFNFNETNGGYVGILPLLATLVALRQWRENRNVRFFGLLGGLSLAVVCDVPIVSNLFNGIPILNIVSNYRLSLFVAFSTCVLCAFGLESILAGGLRTWDLRVLRGGALVGVAALAASAVAVAQKEWVLASLTNLLTLAATQARLTASFTYRGPWVVPFSLDEMLPLVRAYTDSLGAYLATGAAAILGSVIALGSLTRSGRRAWVVEAACGVVLFADLFAFGARYNPRTEVVPRTTDDAWLAVLRADATPHRTLFLDGVAPANLPMLFGIEDAVGYDALDVKRYRELSMLAVSEERVDRDITTVPFREHKVASLLNIKYIVATSTDPGPPFQRIHEGAVNVYQNPDCLPRSYVVTRVRVVADDRTRLQAIVEPRFDPRREVLLEEPLAEKTGEGEGSARVVRSDGDRVVIDATSESDAMLVLLDTWYPGWKAFVDGREVKVHRAYHAFRAVALPAGSHVVTFEYEPWSFRAGAGISVLGMMALGALLSRKA